jgi:hypothetical protein
MYPHNYVTKYIVSILQPIAFHNLSIHIVQHFIFMDGDEEIFNTSVGCGKTLLEPQIGSMGVDILT